MDCVIFGGAGFIGQHFARFLISEGLAANVTLVDAPGKIEGELPILGELAARCERVAHDVRQPIPASAFPAACDLICNFAAVHREPGHESHEYYETNLPGAEHVCAWARAVGCRQIIFTSSISPYGPSTEQKTEQSIPTPVTAYGGSKLAAEKIHQVWQAEDAGRRLVILRPGVVFGAREGGNVSRLIKSVLGRYMFYMGNHGVRKAGIYVKELCRIAWWALQRTSANEPVVLLNATMNPGPSMQEYVDAICRVAGVRRRLLNLPFGFLYAGVTGVELLAGAVRIQTPINRVRLNKLVRPNDILPRYLVDNGYEYHYTLESALRDWKEEAPFEWR